MKLPNVHYAPSSANPAEYVGGIYGGNVLTATGPANKALERMQLNSQLISKLRGVASKAMAVLHDFVTKTYYEVAFRGIAESIFDLHKRQVDGLLAKSAGEALQKIPSIAERLAASDPEAISHAMTTARRVLCSFADAVYPPTSEPVIFNGQQMDCRPDKYFKSAPNIHQTTRGQSVACRSFSFNDSKNVRSLQRRHARRRFRR